MAEIKDIVNLTLGYDSKTRKNIPLLATLFGYFAAAMKGLAEHCVRSNKQHNGDEPVHWARNKSPDHDECILRHSLDMKEMMAWLRRNPNHPEYQTVLTHASHEYDARLWRAAADSQIFKEEFCGAPLPFNTFLSGDKPGKAPDVTPPAAEIYTSDIMLYRYPPDRKVAIIKAIRTITGCSLKEAKDLSERSFPIPIPIPMCTTVGDAQWLLQDAGGIIRGEDL